MVHKWGSEDLIENIQKDCNPDPEELIDLIRGSELNPHIKVVLIAEAFDPEVVITSDWLKDSYGIDISAFAISLHKMGEHHFLDTEQRYPLKELSDAFDSRARRKKAEKVKPAVEWADVLPKLQYPFAKRGIELCRKFQDGDPPRRRFGRIKVNHDGFSWISLNFRAKYINIYLGGDYDRAQEVLQSKFDTPITINTWRDGLSFLVETANQFENLVTWLELEQK